MYCYFPATVNAEIFGGVVQWRLDITTLLWERAKCHYIRSVTKPDFHKGLLNDLSNRILSLICCYMQSCYVRSPLYFFSIFSVLKFLPKIKRSANFGASTLTRTWKTGLPKISLNRTADFGEYRKYYTTESFCFYSQYCSQLGL